MTQVADGMIILPETDQDNSHITPGARVAAPRWHKWLMVWSFYPRQTRIIPILPRVLGLSPPDDTSGWWYDHSTQDRPGLPRVLGLSPPDDTSGMGMIILPETDQIWLLSHIRLDLVHAARIDLHQCQLLAECRKDQQPVVECTYEWANSLMDCFPFPSFTD